MTRDSVFHADRPSSSVLRLGEPSCEDKLQSEQDETSKGRKHGLGQCDVAILDNFSLIYLGNYHLSSVVFSESQLDNKLADFISVVVTALVTAYFMRTGCVVIFCPCPDLLLWVLLCVPLFKYSLESFE